MDIIMLRIPPSNEKPLGHTPYGDGAGVWSRMHNITWRNFSAKRQQVLELEATTHRLESLLDSPPPPVFECMYFVAKS